MLLDISKLLLLIVQIITTTTLINIILLSSCCSSGVKSLPITSKPIESTAENLAWEAWINVPVNQQVKTRKVTPKSIFIVPNKNNHSSNCPPGEYFSQNRCIPVVAIDTDKALFNTLQQYVPSGGPIDEYDYNYDEESNFSPAGAEKLEGSADTNPFSGGDFVDEPLKFNIFSDTFPIGSSGSGDSSGGMKDTEDEKFFIVTESRRRRPPSPPDTPLPDLDTDSSNYGPKINQSGNGDLKNPDDGSTLFLSGIDAILVPAVSSENQHKNQNINFSIYQETLNASSTMPQINPTDESIKHDFEEFLKNESLFLDENGAWEKTTSTTTTTTERNEAKSTSSLNSDTTTMKLEEEEYEDYESKTEFTRSITDLPPIAEETSQPTNFEKYITTTIIVPKDDTTTMITDPKEEDITTITSLNEELNKTEPTSSKTDISTIIVVSNAETSTIANSAKDEITFPKKVPTTTDLPMDEETTTPQNQNEDYVSEENASNNRFVYHKLTEDKSLPPVIDIVEELRKINDLVAKNTRPASTSSTVTTTQNPSEETISNSTTNFLSKIILSSNTMKTSSEDPVPLSSTSTVWSSNSTSRNILSNSSSSGSSSSTVSSAEESQESTSDPSSSTSPIPEINEPDPYWWMPSGWSAERTEAERPLLMRFWSVFSGMGGSQTKV